MAETHKASNSGPTLVSRLTLSINRLYTFARPLLKDKKVSGTLQLFLSVGLLIWLGKRVGLEQIVDILSSVSWAWYLPVFLLFIVNVMIRAYRWYVLLDVLQSQVSYIRLVYLYFVGFFFDNFIPSGFGGDIVKVLSLHQGDSRGTDALSSVLADRLTGFIGSSFIALLALIWNSIWERRGQSASLSLPPVILVSTALVSLGVPLGFLILRQSDPLSLLATHLPLVKPIVEHDKLQRLVQTIRCYPFSTLGQALLINLPFTINLVFIKYGIAKALSVQVPFHLFPLFVPLISVINVLPLSFNGLGMREGAYQLLFVPAGVSSAGAIAMSLAFYFLRVGTGLIGGLLYALESIRNVTQETQAKE